MRMDPVLVGSAIGSAFAELIRITEGRPLRGINVVNRPCRRVKLKRWDLYAKHYGHHNFREERKRYNRELRGLRNRAVTEDEHLRRCLYFAKYFECQLAIIETEKVARAVLNGEYREVAGDITEEND